MESNFWYNSMILNHILALFLIILYLFEFIKNIINRHCVWELKKRLKDSSPNGKAEGEMELVCFLALPKDIAQRSSKSPSAFD